MARKQVVIVGGGIAGLTAAYRLSADADVVLLEATPSVGGQIATTWWDGLAVERGGEGFVARSQAVPALCADLGMPESDVIAQATLRSFGYDGRELQALAPGEAAVFLGFQVPPDDLGKGIRSLRRGMGSLIDALAAQLRGRAEVRVGAQAITAAARADGVYVELASGPALRADGLIVATAALPASELLTGLVAEPARALSAAVTQSSVTVELAYPQGAVDHALDGSGFVVAQAAQREGLRACTFSSSKFTQRAPAGRVSLRAFFRPSAADLSLSEAAWIERAARGIGRVLTLRGEPLHAWVSRWPNALPVFDEAHRARVAALESVLSTQRVVLAGAAFHGSGIDAAVRSGELAATRLRGA